MNNFNKINVNFRVANPKKEYSSLQIRYTNPITKKRDRTITCAFLQLKKDELAKDTVLVDAKRKEIFRLINVRMREYMALLDDISLFDETAFKMAVFSVDKTNNAKINLSLNLINIVEKEMDKYFKKNPNLSDKGKSHYIYSLKQLTEFEKFKSKPLTVHNLTPQLMVDFEDFLLNIQKLKTSTARSRVTYLLTLLRNYFREKNDVEKIMVLDGYDSEIKRRGRKDVLKAYISEDEIIGIFNTDFDYYKGETDREIEIIRQIGGLNIIRDWAVLGFYLGQRLQTLRILKNEQIKEDRIVDIYQQKTDTYIPYIPFYGLIKDVLDRYDGCFPPKIGRNNNFNDGLRMICRLYGLNDSMVGDITEKVIIDNKETTRLKRGYYPRWMLISSHSLRRSTITNFHKIGLDANLGMAITGQKSELVYHSYNNQSQKDKLDTFFDLAKTKFKTNKETKEKETKVIKLDFRKTS